MRILIVGSDANAYYLAKQLSELEKVDLVFVAPGNSKIEGFATNVDIREDDVEEILEFAKANEISLTIPVSEKAIASSVVDVFNKEKINIFGPTLDSARMALFKSSAKKLLYKLRVQTPKFGIFDKENAAIDYIRRSKYPLVLKNDVHIDGDFPVFVETFPKAKYQVERFFEDFNKKLVIEDFVNAKEATLYFLTDGYAALPIGSVCSKKFDNNGLGQEFLNTKSAFSPDYFISAELESKIMSRVIYPLLDDVAKHSSPYVGILGVDVFTGGNNFQILEFNPFFRECDFQAILPLLKENILELFMAAIYGSLADDYNHLAFSAKVSYSIELALKEKFEEDEDMLYSYGSSNRVIITSVASTLGIASERLKDYVATICSVDSLSEEAFNFNKGARDLEPER